MNDGLPKICLPGELRRRTSQTGSPTAFLCFLNNFLFLSAFKDLVRTEKH